MYNMHFSDEEMVGSVAIFNTKLDMFFTGVWPKRFAERILRMWERNGQDISVCELRKRELDAPDNTAILIIDINNFVIACFHWDNKGYAKAYTDETYKLVKYTPPQGIDVRDEYDFSEVTKWNKKGKLLTSRILEQPIS